MKEVAKHHRILRFPSALGIEEEWLAIDCAFVESGIRYAIVNNCKRILFGSIDDTKKAAKVSIDVLRRLEGLEGLIWQIPIPKGADLSALETHAKIRYLSIVQPHLVLDLSVFPVLEYLQFFYSKTITGYARASELLSHISVTGLSSSLAVLDPFINLVKLDIVRSDIESLSGIEGLSRLEELSIVRCGKLASLSHAAKLKRLHSLSIESATILTDLSALREFRSLKTLWVKLKKIESCAFISQMNSIEFASINAEIMDNDLSPFLKSNSLIEVWFCPMKRAYSPNLSPDNINALLAEQRGCPR